MFYLKRYLYIAIIGFTLFQLLHNADWAKAGPSEVRIGGVIHKRVPIPGYTPFCNFSPPSSAPVINLRDSYKGDKEDTSRFGRPFQYYDFSAQTASIAQIFVIENRTISGMLGTENSSDFLFRVIDRFGEQVRTGYFNMSPKYIEISSPPGILGGPFKTKLLPSNKRSANKWIRALNQSRKDCGFSSPAYLDGGQLLVRLSSGKWYIAHSTGSVISDPRSSRNREVDSKMARSDLNNKRISEFHRIKGPESTNFVISDFGLDTLLLKNGGRYISYNSQSMYLMNQGLMPYDSNYMLNGFKDTFRDIKGSLN